jgi:hypothetical protein
MGHAPAGIREDVEIPYRPSSSAEAKPGDRLRFLLDDPGRRTHERCAVEFGAGFRLEREQPAFETACIDSMSASLSPSTSSLWISGGLAKSSSLLSSSPFAEGGEVSVAGRLVREGVKIA